MVEDAADTAGSSGRGRPRHASAALSLQSSGPKFDERQRGPEGEGVRRWSSSQQLSERPSDAAVSRSTTSLHADSAGREEEWARAQLRRGSAHLGDAIATIAEGEESNQLQSKSSSTSTLVQAENTGNSDDMLTPSIVARSQELPDEESRSPNVSSQLAFDHYQLGQETPPRHEMHDMHYFPTFSPISRSSHPRPTLMHHRTSLNDLTAMTSHSGSNLASTQHLSQSVREVSRHSPREPHGRYDLPTAASQSTFYPVYPSSPHKSHSRSQGQLNRLVTETRLGINGPPGLSSTVTAAMASNREEIRQHRRSRYPSASGRGSEDGGRGSRTGGGNDHLRHGQWSRDVSRSSSSVNHRAYSGRRHQERR